MARGREPSQEENKVHFRTYAVEVTVQVALIMLPVCVCKTDALLYLEPIIHAL